MLGHQNNNLDSILKIYNIIKISFKLLVQTPLTVAHKGHLTFIHFLKIVVRLNFNLLEKICSEQAIFFSKLNLKNGSNFIPTKDA